MRLKEPLIHSHVEDRLPEEHQMAFRNIHCRRCLKYIHASDNVNISTWVETGCGDYCLKCFSVLCGEVLAKRFGINISED
jgi:hypothetical protein